VDTKRTALITGASGGIGLELAKLFARDGYDLALIARSREKLNSIADELEKAHNVEIKYCSRDLAVSSTPEEILQSIRSEMIEIDVLVNNAGFGWYGEFCRMEVADALEMIQVNVTALTHLTRLLLPDMVRRNRGKILNVASTAAFQPGPLMAVYYATKAYVLSFSQALSEELKDTDVTVTTLCPGPTATGFGRRAGTDDRIILGGLLSTDVQYVARAGYEGLMKGKPVVIPGKLNWLGTELVRLLPRSLPPKIIKNVQKKRGM
jgi:short-subunit dehydrogenase